MNIWSGLGIFSILLIVVLVIISLWFSVVTATLIATAIGATGWNWWIVSITIFCALGGMTGGSLINIKRD